jgi:hypothetical protein
MQRLVFPLLLAALCAAVAASRVYLDFERVRFRVVTAPVQPTDDGLTVPLPDLTRLAASRAAIVLRLRSADTPADVAVALDGRRIGRVEVPAGTEVRVDLAAHVDPARAEELTFAAAHRAWELTYLEIANVHGYSRGIVDLVIVPHERSAPGTFRPLTFAVVLLVLLPLMPRPFWGTRRQRWLYWTGALVVMLLFGTTLLVDAFTRFRILLSLPTFLLCTAVLYAEPIARLRAPLEPHARRALPHVERGIRRWGPWAPYVALPVLTLWCVGQFYRPEVGFTELIKFGEQFSPTAHPVLRATPHAVEAGSGYDGQFYAQLVFDPLVQSEEIVTALDSPGYRARRILFPWIAWAAGFGHPWLALQAYALLNVVAWLLLAWILLRWLPPGSARRTAAWCGCLLAEGMLASVRQSLVDGPSMLLLALGIVAVEQNHRWRSAALLGISGLGRDTNVIGGLILAPSSRRTHRLGATVLQGLVVCAPLLLWMLYLRQAEVSPVETGHSNFAFPFTAFVQKWQVTVAELSAGGWDSFARFSILSLVALTTQFVVLVSLLDWRNAWWRMGIAYAGLMIVVGEAVWYGYPGATARVVLPMTVAFNVLLPSVRLFWPLWIAGNVNMLVGLSALRVPWIWEYI